MSIDILTLVYPPISPILQTTATSVNANGGIYSAQDNISSVKIANMAIIPYNEMVATLVPLGGGDYQWECLNIPLINNGLNTLKVIAVDALNDIKTIEVSVYAYTEVFDTTPPLLESSYPVHLANNVTPLLRISVTFNEPMNTASTVGALTLIPDAGGAWVSDTVKDFHYEIGSNLLSYDTAYTINFGSGVKDLAGNVASISDITFIIRPAPANQIGQDNNSLPFFNDSDFVGIGQLEPSPQTKYGYMSTQLSVRAMAHIGNEGTNTFDGYSDLRGISFGAASVNQVILINSFRGKPNIGTDATEQLMPIYHDANVPVSGATDVAPMHRYGYLTTQLLINSRSRIGTLAPMITTPFSLKPTIWLPQILNYAVHDVESEDGMIKNLAVKEPTIHWTIPDGMKDKKMFFRVDFSRSPSFFKVLSFDSVYNNDLFRYSKDENTYSFFPPNGTNRNSGASKFDSTSPLTHGIWYVRIRAMYEKE
jgi:hypothetical protein